MDVVITYVNGLDPQWQREYAVATNQSVLVKRYRDWGLLPYLLRGIEKYMPYVEQVFLVVSSESQVPEWVNREYLKIVLHKDIIPQEYLPTFNSCTIEQFLHNIPALNNHFVYFNDDIYPVAPIAENTFFDGEKIVMHFAHHLFALGMYKQQTKMSDRLARKAAGVRKCCTFIRPQHTCTPMVKKINKMIWEKLSDQIKPMITPLRVATNPNQYIYTDYHYFTNNVVSRRIPTKHCSMAIYSPEKIAKHLLKPTRPLICINDVAMKEEQRDKMYTILHQAFSQRFPEKSCFEK